MMNELMQDVERILITTEQIEQKVAELGEIISRDYQGKNPLLVCTLRGATIFCAELMKHLTIPMEVDFIAASSYGSNGTDSTGIVKIVKDLSTSIQNRHVIIVEDIVDTGLTLTNLKSLLSVRNPASLKIATLLDKPSRRLVPLKADYCGFEVEDLFVIGYGLDYKEKYRNLNFVGVLKPEVYKGC